MPAKVGQTKTEFHATWIRSYKMCPRKYYYEHIMKIVPAKPPKSLVAGRCMHKLLESYYLGNENPLEEFDRYAAKEIALLPKGYVLDDIYEEIDLVRKVGEAYIEWAKEGDKFKVKKVNGETCVEKEFKVPIFPAGVRDLNRVKRGKGVLAGRFDLIVEDEYGHTWLVDHKTASQFPDESLLKLDVQMNYYFWAATLIFGTEFKGIIYNVLRKTDPNKAKKELFKRYKILVGRQTLYNIQNDLYWTYRTIARDKHFLRSTGNCKWCSYREICTTELDGRKIDSLMGTLYVPKEEMEVVDDTIQELN